MVVTISKILFLGNIMENINKRIEKLCHDNMLSKADLARMLGVGEQAVYSWCAGRRQMDSKNYEKFCYFEKVSGCNNLEMSSKVEKLCNETTFSNQSTDSTLWASKLLDACKHSLIPDTRQEMGSKLSHSLTKFITSFETKDVLNLLSQISLSLSKKLEEDSLNDKDFIVSFKEKWAKTNLSLEYVENKKTIKFKYSYKFSKQEANKIKKKIKELSEMPEFSGTLKTRKHVGITLTDLNEKELSKYICRLYSFETCFGQHNLSTGTKFSKSTFEDTWSLDISNNPDWRTELRTIDKKLSRTESLSQSLFKEIHIYNTLLSFSNN